MTGEELARWRDFHGELVNGRPVPMPMAGRSHAKYQVRVSVRLHTYAEETGRGLPGFSLPLSDLFQD